MRGPLGRRGAAAHVTAYDALALQNCAGFFRLSAAERHSGRMMSEQ